MYGRSGALAALALALPAGACGRVGFDGARPDAEGRVGYREVVLADGPVGYWRLGDAGGTARDESSLGPGTYLGTCQPPVVGLIADDPDAARDFASTCAVRVDLPPFAGTAPFTLEAWVTFVGAPATYTHVLTLQDRGLTDPIRGYAVVVTNRGEVYAERVVAGAATATAPRHPLSPGAHHLVARYDGAKVELFVDGARVGQSPLTVASLDPVTTPGLIGAAIRPVEELIDLFPGVIDEVAVYATALPDARIEVHHQAGS